ncbi:hypothetical protein MCOR25_006228 [Pyricularia grisea]|nr:hypothetical protein MCOR25_006228 [Pyricularia grisea]
MEATSSKRVAQRPEPRDPSTPKTNREGHEPDPKRHKSPPPLESASPSTGMRGMTSTAQHRNRAKPPAADAGQAFVPVPRQHRMLYQDGTSGLRRQAKRGKGGGTAEEFGEGEKVNVLVKQPETRPIGQGQLVAEVKGTYAG